MNFSKWVNVCQLWVCPQMAVFLERAFRLQGLLKAKAWFNLLTVCAYAEAEAMRVLHTLCATRELKATFTGRHIRANTSLSIRLPIKVFAVVMTVVMNLTLNSKTMTIKLKLTSHAGQKSYLTVASCSIESRGMFISAPPPDIKHSLNLATKKLCVL